MLYPYAYTWAIFKVYESCYLYLSIMTRYGALKCQHWYFTVWGLYHAGRRVLSYPFKCVVYHELSSWWSWDFLCSWGASYAEQQNCSKWLGVNYCQSWGVQCQFFWMRFTQVNPTSAVMTGVTQRFPFHKYSIVGLSWHSWITMCCMV